LGVVQASRIERFGEAGYDSRQLVEELGTPGRRELREWIRQRGPVGRYLTRHTRETLRRYHQAGLLKETVPRRDVRAVSVRFTRDEQQLYDQLDDLLDRLMQAHGTRRGAGFVLTIYRRRLTSSWEAIRRTLRRRVDHERLFIEQDLEDEADESGLDTGEGAMVDDAHAVPLTAQDLREIETYLQELERVPDSKFDQLVRDLNEARGRRQPVIVFTQFTDTLHYLRDRLRPAYRSQLATFTGDGGSQWLETEEWVGVSKQDLVKALQNGRVSVILATDAASEGLNLQVASHLINFDLPWNPMRVEQRIGRIDRIGQPAPVVVVRNYVVPGTVEESVYAALANRIDMFSGLLGKLQPILGATEEAFRSIFRMPRSERQQSEREAIARLVDKVEELERSGIDISDEDPMPMPQPQRSPVTLGELHTALVDWLGIRLDQAGRPVTFDPDRVSRDRERWAALATYGHPRLEPAIEHFLDADHPGALVVRGTGLRRSVYRSDRTPPARVDVLSDLEGLGPPVSTQEAEQLARHDAEAADNVVTQRIGVADATRRQAWEDGVRERFRDLVHRAILAGVALRQADGGDSLEPQLIWLDLCNDDMSGWGNADLFRRYLGIDLSQILPTSKNTAAAMLPDQLRRERQVTGRLLLNLIDEWKAVALPDARTASR
jgi:hypothetical protein